MFLKEGGWRVRGITRDPSKPSSTIWADQGVELITADLEDVASLTKAFAGSTIIFGVTDFWGQISNPKLQAKAQESGRPLNVEAYHGEVQLGRNIVDAANATVDTLDRFVLSTLSPAKKWSKGKYSKNYHFDAKWTAVEYLKETYPELAKKTSYLQVGLYMTNWESPLMQHKKVSEAIYLTNKWLPQSNHLSHLLANLSNPHKSFRLVFNRLSANYYGVSSNQMAPTCSGCLLTAMHLFPWSRLVTTQVSVSLPATL